MTGKFAVSKSGHDKGQLYLIVREDERYVFLADGEYKTVAHPKKKNKRHIQIIKQIPEEVSSRMSQHEGFLDLEVKRAIKLFKRNIV